MILLRGVALLLAFAAALQLAWAAFAAPGSPLRAALSKHTTKLNEECAQLWLPELGPRLVLAQLGAAGLGALASWATATPYPLIAVVAAAWAPQVAFAILIRRRLEAIERALPAMALSLANGVRVTPNLASALAQTAQLTTEELQAELGLAMKELHLGSSLERVLLRMSARVRSKDLDAIVAGLLIGRQVGGRIPEILETLSATLREMGRLEGVLRSKTSDARTQLVVLVTAPAGLVWLMSSTSPGYFDPLWQHPAGIPISVVAGLLWAGSIAAAKSILAVEL